MRRVIPTNFVKQLSGKFLTQEVCVVGSQLGSEQCRSQYSQPNQLDNFQGIEAQLQPNISHPKSLLSLQHQTNSLQGPLQDYLNARSNGFYRDDELQEKAAQLLQNLYTELTTNSQISPLNGINLSQQLNGGSWWNRFGIFMQNSDIESQVHSEVKSPLVRGVYMFGGVGTGKTMLMDMFARGLIATGKQKVQRQHFHDFMIGVHQKLKSYQGQKDPLCMVAEEILSECNVLCLDEFFVTDVADAMILNRLFGKLWFGGLILVTTSNRNPDALYEGGLQRDLFIPFILQLKDHCIVHDMASQIDHRSLAQQQQGSFFTGPDSESELQQRFAFITNNKPKTTELVSVIMGRQLSVPKAVDKACHFQFADLCEKPLSAADYLSLSENYHTVAVSNIPIFRPINRLSAYRFVSLIDVLYERKIRLLCSAEGTHEELMQHVMTSKEWHQQQQEVGNKQISRYSGSEDDSDLLIDNNLGFAKHRTVSRLGEMQSLEYAVEHAERHEPQLLLALKEAQQKLQSRQNQ